MKFKVGDKVRIKENGFQGEIIEIHQVDFMSKDGLNGCFKLFYSVSNGKLKYGKFEEWQLEFIEENKIAKFKTPEQIKLEELEKRIEKLEKCANLTQNNVKKCANVSNLEKNEQKSLLTNDERVILRNINKKYKWIARDRNESLFLYEEKPFKKYDYWGAGQFDYDEIGFIFKELFQFIKWEDEEPYSIDELLEE